jgi:hypothetical protein
LDDLLSGLPDSAQDLIPTCTIRYAGGETASAGRSDMYRNLSVVKIIQTIDGRAATTDRRLAPRMVDLFDEKYPGSSQVDFVFYETDGGPEIERLSIKGPWSIFALIHKYNGARQSADPSKWLVEIPVAYLNTELSFWLEFEFENVLPTIRDWP